MKVSMSPTISSVTKLSPKELCVHGTVGVGLKLDVKLFRTDDKSIVYISI